MDEIEKFRPDEVGLCGAEHYYVKGLHCAREKGHDGWHLNGVKWR